MKCPFERCTGLECGEQWGRFVGCRAQRDGCRVSFAEWWGSKAAHKQSIKQWSVPESHCSQKSTVFVRKENHINYSANWSPSIPSNMPTFRNEK